MVVVGESSYSEGNSSASALWETEVADEIVAGAEALAAGVSSVSVADDAGGGGAVELSAAGGYSDNGDASAASKDGSVAGTADSAGVYTDWGESGDGVGDGGTSSSGWSGVAGLGAGVAGLVYLYVTSWGESGGYEEVAGSGGGSGSGDCMYKTLLKLNDCPSWVGHL